MPSDRPKKAKTSAPAVPEIREPTPAEVAMLERVRASQAQRPARATLALVSSPSGDTRTLAVRNSHTDSKGWTMALCEAFGTRSGDYCDDALARLTSVLMDRGKAMTETQINGMLALMGAIAPQDELEAAIGAQIVACHVASLDFMNRARMNAGEYRDTAVAYAGVANKFSRTMTAQVEALAKLRNGGKSTHEVRYVYVNGPAAFGPGAKAAAVYGGGGDAANPGQSHAPLAIEHDGGEPCPPVWSEDAERQAVRGAGREGSEAMSDARGHEPRGADGEGERRVHVRALDAGVAGGPRSSPRHAEAGEGNP